MCLTVAGPNLRKQPGAALAPGHDQGLWGFRDRVGYLGLYVRAVCPMPYAPMGACISFLCTTVSQRACEYADECVRACLQVIVDAECMTADGSAKKKGMLAALHHKPHTP